MSPVHQGRQHRALDGHLFRPRTYEANERVQAKNIRIDDIPYVLSQYVDRWTTNKTIRFSKFGIPAGECGPLLKHFSQAVNAGKAFKPEDYHMDMINRFAQILSKPSDDDRIDSVLCKVFYTWATKSKGYLLEHRVASESTLNHMENLLNATDYRFPTEWFPGARAMKRKVIMHVGPTNSGKTHNALRALAAARAGCYAGPLRLLAHEIADRLNKGQIVPLGAEVKPNVEADANTNLDVGSAPVVTSSGDGRYARPCNLITGELRIVVEPLAGLLSCTVEMINFYRYYDVAVIDEIQMIADHDRGSAWSYAVLGVRAKELHLCGEESAVPIVEAMLKETGDELIVNRYERLTPLVVADKSLEGDLKKVQPGDCIVAFSRTTILQLKHQVEKTTGLRAAIVYGRLPPEVRSTQAALFNEPSSGYDVLIGSDAIGMGLNLKIKRIIFHTMGKWDGKKVTPLSISQTKQIAGRAGRYGLHGDSNAGGVVTTLLEEDLEILQNTMAKPAPSLPAAYIRSYEQILDNIYEQLPVGTLLSTLNEVERCLAVVCKPYELESVDSSQIQFHLIDTIGNALPIAERLSLVQMPIPSRDTLVSQFARNLTNLIRREGKAELKTLLETTDMFKALVEVLNLVESGKPIPLPQKYLPDLESLDKSLSAYAWLAYRNTVVFPDQEATTILKGKAQLAIDSCLSALSTLKQFPQRKKSSANRGSILPNPRDSRLATSLDDVSSSRRAKIRPEKV
ncbi:P-loop containing nucleoside triphosphate hydrolase protein [Neolentinus lepideus HHB14362 ss-1]|uniref:p-loop containing nucleoside triphosphate hydrolase protein n=1 Tax=Neolentinus lepideus HHB14362 ss-1 TaxID=1314782 RepID=A0A165MV86_9AGAM|nr:P-loop containing nucleoside triphosphate hydrolase protein [Neolentinus lepideus HHB14362 ss-1]